jgi:enterochelin esterase-like enzyme
MTADGDVATFQLADARRSLRAVRLLQEVGLTGPLDFERVGHTWTLAVPRPDVDRMEYLFEIDDRRGRRATILDPANPQRVGGAFGDKSVREFPGYRAPDWLDTEPVTAHSQQVCVPAAALDADVELTLWSPDALADDDPAPLIVVHDGPEYAQLGGMTHFLGAAVATGVLPPVRAALLAPGERNEWYAANPDYAAALCGEVLPAVSELGPSTVRIGVGASLGALAMLHAHRHQPGTFGALLLQSGSFFASTHDAHESEFPGWQPITDFVSSVAGSAGPATGAVPTVLTCGTVEENLANNRAMADHLRRLGYPVDLVVVRDAHNYTAWRDALDPWLPGLVAAAVAGARAA